MTPAQDGTLPLRRPQSAGELFRVFTRLALQGFGGVLPIAHRELVERERWVAPAEFVELLAAAQVIPGPNIVNVALMLGDRWFGLRGALAASAGLLAVPMLIVLALATLYQQAVLFRMLEVVIKHKWRLFISPANLLPKTEVIKK
mgnify:CR=1 FL=1